MVADDVKDTLLNQARRIIRLDSMTMQAQRDHISGLMRNEERLNQLVAAKDEQLKLYAANEKDLRKIIKRQKLSRLVGYVLAAGAAVFAIIK